jgi:hypothetical protein
MLGAPRTSGRVLRALLARVRTYVDTFSPVMVGHCAASNPNYKHSVMFWSGIGNPRQLV